jgi:hypothetical protein
MFIDVFRELSKHTPYTVHDYALLLHPPTNPPTRQHSDLHETSTEHSDHCDNSLL